MSIVPNNKDHETPGDAQQELQPHEVHPPLQAPDLLEDTALPLSGLQEAFAKAYAWQQQQISPDAEDLEAEPKQEDPQQAAGAEDKHHVHEQQLSLATFQHLKQLDKQSHLPQQQQQQQQEKP